MPIDAKLIIAQSEQLYGLRLSERRAEELAEEVERLNTATAAAATSLELEDQPQRHAATLRALAERHEVSHG